MYIISEIGINHNGDLNLAKELIDISVEHGCHAVKFQKRDINTVYSQEELDKFRESPWGTTNREQKEGLEFSIEQYVELENYTKSKNIDFIVSCWDLVSLDLVEQNLNVKYHKVASAILTDKEFLLKLKETNKPIIISTGMTTPDDINKSLEVLGDNVKIILACTSTYPTKPEEINLNYIQTLKQNYPSKIIGFSNHYSGVLACHGAVALGSEVIEFHITKDRTMYGSDQAASIENVEGLVNGINAMGKMIGDGKKVIYQDELPIQEKLRKVNSL